MTATEPRRRPSAREAYGPPVELWLSEEGTVRPVTAYPRRDDPNVFWVPAAGRHGYGQRRVLGAGLYREREQARRQAYHWLQDALTGIYAKLDRLAEGEEGVRVVC